MVFLFDFFLSLLLGVPGTIFEGFLLGSSTVN